MACSSMVKDIFLLKAFEAGADAVTGQTIFVDGGAHMKGFARDFVNLG